MAEDSSGDRARGYLIDATRCDSLRYVATGTPCACDATALDRGTVRTNCPNWRHSSSRHDHARLPFHAVMSGQPSHMFWRPSGRRSMGWMIITDWRWVRCTHTRGSHRARAAARRTPASNGASQNRTVKRNGERGHRHSRPRNSFAAGP